MRDESTQSLYEFNKDLSTVSDESLRLELEMMFIMPTLRRAI